MADISIEVNEINVVRVERSAKGYLSLSVKAQVEGRAETVVSVERCHFPSI